MIARSRDDVMGMPIVIKIIDEQAQEKDIDTVFQFFETVDERFSTFKQDSEISQFNRGEVGKRGLSADMKTIFRLSLKTQKETDGYFNIQKPDKTIDPSGIVKGWAIWEAAKLLTKMDFRNFFIEAGGDIQVNGVNEKGEEWRVGIRNPFNKREIVKVLDITNKGIATSGTYEKGQHVYNPHAYNTQLKDIVSITVIGPNIYEADRFATAVFAMQEQGIHFLEKQKYLEGYMIDKNGLATMTSGFEQYVRDN